MSTGEAVGVEPGAGGGWVVQVRREWEGHSAVGRVKVALRPGDAAPAQAPHAVLAGARAWLSLGQERLAAGQAPAAVACAQRGLSELGGDYAPPTAVDDTTLKLAAAEEELKAGRVENAASTMLRMLDTRARLYVEKHAGAVQ